MKKQAYKIVLSDPILHKEVYEETIQTDGYMTALHEAKKLCAEHSISDLYVSQVIKV